MALGLAAAGAPCPAGSPFRRLGGAPRPTDLAGLLPLANQAVFAQARGHLTMPANAAETAGMLGGSRTEAVQLARLHMAEVANSARPPWVAYGDRHGDPGFSPLARHFRWKVSLGLASLELGSVARTELGLFPPGARTLSQVWSAQRLRLVARAFGFTKRLNVVSLVEMDQLYAQAPRAEHQYFLLFSVPGWLRPILPGVGAVRDAISAALRRYAPVPEQRMFWMAPYVYFAPRARAAPAPGPSAPLGNFAQPDVLVGLALPARQLQVDGGVTRKRFSWSGRRAGSASVDFRFTEADGPRIPGLPEPLQALQPGLNAFAAAQACYHRPGDWREVPNFFNPLWGARLMPIAESNAANLVPGLVDNPVVRGLLLH